jgi:hypothetical protein
MFFFLKVHLFLARLGTLPVRAQMMTLFKALGITVAIALVIDGAVAIAILKKALSTDAIPYMRAANCLILIAAWVVCVNSKTKQVN